MTFVVGQRFFLSLCRCPIVVCIDFGRCLQTSFVVNPGSNVSQLLLIAQINVVTTGAPNVVWNHA